MAAVYQLDCQIVKHVVFSSLRPVSLRHSHTMLLDTWSSAKWLLVNCTASAIAVLIRAVSPNFVLVSNE